MSLFSPKPRPFALASALVAILASAPSHAAGTQVYLTVVGQKTGAFKGESIQKNFQGKIPVISFHYAITNPTDSATGLPSGRTQLGALSVTKTLGASSPQFFESAVTNELLKTVTLQFYQQSARGTLDNYYTITLTNAQIKYVKQGSGAATPPESEEANVSSLIPLELEEIGFTYQKIQVEDNDAHTVSSDSVLAP